MIDRRLIETIAASVAPGRPIRAASPHRACVARWSPRVTASHCRSLRHRAACGARAGSRGPSCCAGCSPPTCCRARAAVGAAWSPWWWTRPSRARCSRRSGCRARRRRSRLRETHRRASSGSTTLGRPSQPPTRSAGTGLRRRCPHVRALTQPTSGGDRRLPVPRSRGIGASPAKAETPLVCRCRERPALLGVGEARAAEACARQVGERVAHRAAVHAR